MKESRVADGLGGRSSSNRVRRGVIGVLIQQERLLVVRRADHLVKGGYWCFPGGHVERGENSRHAIQREFIEELDIEVLPVERLGSIRVAEGVYVLAVWRVHRVAGRLRPQQREIAELLWLSPEELRKIQPGLRSNDEVLRLLGV